MMKVIARTGKISNQPDIIAMHQPDIIAMHNDEYPLCIEIRSLSSDSIIQVYVPSFDKEQDVYVSIIE